MISDEKKIISLEDEESDNSKNEVKKEKSEGSPYLSDNEIREYLERYRGRIPSVILRDIYEMLKGRRVTEKHIDKIIEKVESMLNAEDQLRKIDDIYKKLESLEKILRQDVGKKVGESKIEEGVEKVEQKEVLKAEDVKSEVVGGDLMKVEHYKEPYKEYQHEDYRYDERKEYPRFVEHTEEYPRYPARRDRQYEDYSFYGAPRLSKIPGDAKRIMLLLKWIEFLMERVGYDGLEDVLNYYVDINWISEDVLMAVLKYARGIKLYHENSDWRPVGYMNVQDHLMSLLYIEALRTGRFDRNLVMEVEKDLYRMKKEVSELHGV